jgi:peptide/nickel transport system permease protein
LVLPDSASEKDVAAMEVKLGLDQPLYVQYFRYISGVFRGDLGTSTQYKTPVAGLIFARFPNTLKLAIVTVLFGLLLCIPLGIIAGSHKGTAIDFFTVLFALLGQSMATVWIAVLVIYIFSVKLGWLPSIGIGGPLYYILPVITLGYPMAAETTRIGRSGMIDTLNEDFITATHAKGIKPSVVFWKYAFKNAICPVITLVGMRMGAFLAGAIVVETIFSWPGIGQLMVAAVGNRDYPLVQSLLLVSATMFAIINLVIDIINSLIDPRIVLE